jgi:beta-glucosidase
MKPLRAAGIALCLLAFGWTSQVLAGRPWNDEHLSPDQRAALLNRELTLDERITMVHGIMAIPSRGGPVPPEAILAAGYVPGVPRLGIPALFESDASLGVANPRRIREGDGGTALPSGLALASTFNPALAYAGGAMIGGWRISGHPRAVAHPRFFRRTPIAQRWSRSAAGETS